MRSRRIEYVLLLLNTYTGEGGTINAPDNRRTDYVDLEGISRGTSVYRRDLHRFLPSVYYYLSVGENETQQKCITSCV
jgi:hypothetical protein